MFKAPKQRQLKINGQHQIELIDDIQTNQPKIIRYNGQNTVKKYQLPNIYENQTKLKNTLSLTKLKGTSVNEVLTQLYTNNESNDQASYSNNYDILGMQTKVPEIGHITKSKSRQLNFPISERLKTDESVQIRPSLFQLKNMNPNYGEVNNSFQPIINQSQSQKQETFLSKYFKNDLPQIQIEIQKNSENDYKIRNTNLIEFQKPNIIIQVPRTRTIKKSFTNNDALVFFQIKDEQSPKQNPKIILSPIKKSNISPKKASKKSIILKESSKKSPHKTPKKVILQNKTSKIITRIQTPKIIPKQNKSRILNTFSDYVENIYGDQWFEEKQGLFTQRTQK